MKYCFINLLFLLLYTNSNGQVVNKNISPQTVIRDSNSLAEIFVKGHKNGMQDVSSHYAARLPIKNLENPQVTNTVPQQLIVQQAATDFSSIMANLPGVVKSWSSVHTYYTSRGFNTRSYYRNGVASFSESELDPANLEQMEAIKGPSGALFGSALTSFGGLFNRITKKPQEHTAVEVGYQMGNDGFSRFTADINAPLKQDSTVLFRLNIAKNYLGSFQDQGYLNSFFIAPSLLYRINKRLTISLDAEFYQRTGTSQPQISLSGSLSDWTRYADYKKLYANNTVILKNPYTAFYGQANYKINNNWLSQTNIIHSQGENTGNYLTFKLVADSLLVRNVTQYAVTSDVVNQVQQNFIGDFQLGKMRNRIVLGLDYYDKNNQAASNGLSGSMGRPSFDTLNLKHTLTNYGKISAANIDAKLASYTANYSTSTQNTYGAYISDILNITEKLSVMASLRWDYFSNQGTYSPATGVTSGKYNQSSLSPKFGMVYQIIANRVSLFGNYTNGFQNVAGSDVNNVSFKPQYANQWEAGIKTELAGQRLNATLSYYDIRVTNTLRGDPANTGFSIQSGTQYSKGLEADINAKPVDGSLLTIGYAHNISKITNADASVNGLRPVNSGPKDAANLWMSYQLPIVALQGIGVGLGGNYVGQNLITNTHTSGAFYTNAYCLFKAGVFYDHRYFRISANVDNLTNKYYYTAGSGMGYGMITPGMLRRLILGIFVKF